MKTQTGFTLIEVLIAMMVLAIGLLGFAALQALSVKNNLAAYTHGQAIQLLYDMSDRMRANRTTAASYLITNSNNVAGPSNTNCTPTAAPTAANAAACTPAVLANNDLFDWNTAITASLPLGKGMIVNTTAVAGCPTTTSTSVYNLCITWDDDRSGVVDANDPTLTMELQP
jgi:type IV pilus assembly protein PilV